MLGDEEEYAWDGEDDQEAAAEEMVQEEEASPPPAPVPAPPLEGAAAFDLSAVLGDDPRDPALDPAACMGTYTPGDDRALFEKLKTQLKDTYISYLCASPPKVLLKQYQGGELVRCLQFLLTELRANLSQRGLEDVVDEEPTTLAEDLHERFPSDWLMHVLDPSALTILGGKYDVPELVDTLQSLSQVCIDRLEDNLGPIQSWVDESSPLRYVPPAEPVTVDTPPAAEDERMSPAANSGGANDGPWSSELAPALWEMHAPAVPAHHAPMHGMAATMGDFRHRTAAPAPRTAAPTFDATLGPALWEQESTPSFPVTAAGPHAMRHATAAPGMRGVHTAGVPQPMTAYGRPAHPVTAHGVPHRPVGQYPTHYVASR